MCQRRPITGFLLRLVAWYAILIAPWPHLDEAYLALFRSAGRLMFGSFGPGGQVRFEPAPPSDRRWVCVMTLRKDGARAHALRHYACRHGYLATALTAALVAATPIPWRRRWKALAAGLVLANLFVAFRLWLGLLDAFSENDAIALYRLPAFWKEAVRLLVRMFVISPEATFVVPVFIWILVAVRKVDLERVLPSFAGK